MEFIQHILKTTTNRQAICGRLTSPIPEMKAGTKVKLCEDCRLIALRGGNHVETDSRVS